MQSSAVNAVRDWRDATKQPSAQEVHAAAERAWLRDFVTIARTRAYEREAEKRKIAEAEKASNATVGPDEVEEQPVATKPVVAEQRTGEESKTSGLPEPAVAEVDSVLAVDEGRPAVRRSKLLSLPDAPNLVVIRNDAMSTEKTHVSSGSEDLWRSPQPIVKAWLPLRLAPVDMVDTAEALGNEYRTRVT